MNIFRQWLLKVLAGDYTVMINAQIHGDTILRAKSYCCKCSFVGRIFAANGKQIFISGDGSLHD